MIFAFLFAAAAFALYAPYITQYTLTGRCDKGINCGVTKKDGIGAFEQDMLLQDIKNEANCKVSVPFKVPKYLIDQARQRVKDSSLLHGDVKFLVRNHPAFHNISEEFIPKTEWKATNFPDISLAGLPKAGTSQLYKILESHPFIVKFAPEKENSFGLSAGSIFPTSVHGRFKNPEAIPTALIREFQKNYFEANEETHKFQKRYNANKKMMTVNGIPKLTAPLMQRQYLDVSNAKVLVLVRDPADWLWAAWNFWNQNSDTIEPTKTNSWAEEQVHYRSPELFHEMMMAGERFQPTQELLTRFRDACSLIYTEVLREIQKTGGKDISALVLKSEDMTPDQVESSGFLARLEEFLGVSSSGFNTTILHSYGNCGSNRGVNARCTKSSSAYAIAGGRSMLPETRELVYVHFYEVCKLWAESFGIVYNECMAVKEKYQL